MRVEADSIPINEKAARRYCRQLIDRAEERISSYSTAYVSSVLSGFGYLTKDAPFHISEMRKSLARLHLTYALITPRINRNKKTIARHILAAAMLDDEVSVAGSHYTTPIFLGIGYYDCEDFALDSSAIRILLTEAESAYIIVNPQKKPDMFCGFTYSKQEK